jgi:SAM-dependent methyltransferase
MLRHLAPLVTPAFWRSWLAEREARAFDVRYGTDTVRAVPVAAMRDVPPDLAAHAVHYEASALPKLRQALDAVAGTLGPRLPSFAFLDVGSGKGLVVMHAARRPFRESVGVEMAPDLHAIAERNTGRFATAHPDAAPMRLVRGDALSCPLPEGPLVAYLYNPFDATFLSPFAARLEAAARPDREILVAYVNPVHRAIFDGSRRVQLLWDNGRVVVYRCLATQDPGVAHRPGPHAGKDAPT